jgi:translocation and assembly module TamB
MRRRLLLGAGVLALLLIAAAAGGLWWLGTDAGLQFAVARIQKSVTDGGNTLQMEGTSGSLYRGIRMERFKWQGGGVEAAGEGLTLQWSPTDLLRRRISVQELVADKIDIRLPPPQPDPAPRVPMSMPASLALPVTFDLQRFAVGELRVTPSATEGNPAPETIVVKDIGARLAYRDALFRLEQFGALTQYGRLADTQLEIADAPPHQVRAKARLEGEVERVAYALGLEASGDLDRLEARASGTVAEAQVRLDATLAPLSVMPLTAAKLEATGVDLKRLRPSAPPTQINANMNLASEDGGRRWAGEVDLTNAAAGTLTDGALPLTAFKSKVALLNADDPAARQLQLRDLQVTLPGNGSTGGASPGGIDGSVDVFPGRSLPVAGVAIPEVQGHFNFKAIDLALFAGQLPRTALDGSLDVQRNDFALLLSQSEERTRAAMPAAFKGAAGAAEVVVRGRLDEATLRLDEARIRLGQSRLQAHGTAGLVPPHQIALKGDARRVDLRQWLPKDTVDERWRQGLISGDWSFDGKVAPGLDAWLTLAFVDSTLAGRPLAADVKTRVVLASDWSPVRIEKTAVDVRFGGNRLRANGALGNPSDKMSIDAAAAEPELLDPRVRGRMTVVGDLNGAFDRLKAQLVATGDRLSFSQGDDTTRLASVRIEANGPVTKVVPPQAPLDLAVRLRALEAAGRKLDSLDLNVNGTLAAHRFNLAAAAEGQSAKLAGDGQAQLGAAPSWNATLASTTLDGTVPMRLTAPASLRVDAGSAQVERFKIAVAGGEATLDRLLVGWGAATTFNTKGMARDLPISRLLAIAGTDADTAALQALQSLRLDADWNLAGSGAEDLTGDARVGVREVQARGAAQTVGLTGDNGARVTLKSGRLDGSFDLSLPSLAFTHRLSGPDLAVDGRLRLAGSVAGTLAQPQWHANLTGQSLSVLQRSVGWRLSDGALTARFEGREFQLQSLSFKAGEGSVTLRGQAGLLDAPRPDSKGGPSTLPLDGRFELTASRFPVPIGPGQRVALSGTTTLSSGSEGLTLRGKLKVDQGTIEIQGSSAPALPDDVKLVYGDEENAPNAGGKPRAGRATEVKTSDRTSAGVPGAKGQRTVSARPDGSTVGPGPGKTKSGIRIVTDLAIDLGDKLRVTGNGIAARLTGNLQVLGALPDEPRLAGVINLVEGSYQSYGQNLRIDKGLVRFNGPIDNPALDITAKRPFLPVDVGIAITGTALNPVITLVSKPDMSETDKLSWLVLGTDPKNAPSAAQTLALREAARTLLVKDDGRYKPGVAERLGLDVMNFGYGSDTGQNQGITESKNPTGLPTSQSSSATAAQQEVVTLGKRIGSRLFVSYEQGVRGVYNLLRIQYTLSQRLSLRAQSGSDNALDLMYSYSFD